MKFYDREMEISTLQNLKGDFRIAVIGRRRIGKTRLIEEFYGSSVLTLFMSAEKAETEIIRGWIGEYGDVYMPKVDTFTELFEYLFTKQERVVFIDEIQNVLRVNKSFVFDLQRLIDKHKPRLIVSGSLIRTLKKLVEEYRSPLFGRFDVIIKLRELDFATVARICSDIGADFETAIMLYSVFGGVPKYYELMEKMKKFDAERFVLDMFVYYPRPLYEEVRTMLKEEFGGEHRILFSILSAVSHGNTRLSEIAGFIGKEQTKITKYLGLLGRDFELMTREEPLIKSGKRGVYRINSNLVDFWFGSVWKHQDLLERGDEKQLAGIILKTIDAHTGRMFERIVMELIAQGKIPMPFAHTEIGKQWGKTEGKPLGKNEYEIDIVALNDGTKEVLFAECKWSRGVDARAVLRELRAKSGHVRWHNGIRKEHYAIFAKSFKEKFKEPNLLLMDLNDIERAL